MEGNEKKYTKIDDQNWLKSLKNIKKQQSIAI